MNLNYNKIQINADKLENAGYDVHFLELYWFTDDENTEWLINNKDLYEHHIYGCSIETKKLVPLTQEMLLHHIEESEEELKNLETLGKSSIKKSLIVFLNNVIKTAQKELDKITHNENIT
jgi:hypothetical protein